MAALAFNDIFWQSRDHWSLVFMSFKQTEILSQKLKSLSSLQEQVFCLDEEITRLGLSDAYEEIVFGYGPFSLEEERVLKQLFCIGEGKGVSGASKEQFALLVSSLLAVDRFYQELGGLIGYQSQVLCHLEKKAEPSFAGASFHSPQFHDISRDEPHVDELISQGLDALPFTAEFYPLGGAADRLHLVDAETGLDLPAAKMQFAGRSLFEGLIRDIQAREFLYEKTYGKKITVPIGIMTSMEKDNHRFILQMCEEKKWFGRPKESFRVFCQPLVPAVNEKGEWIWLGQGKPLLKPGGHGALWKVAKDAGALAWLRSQGIQQILVRQVNNPLAGIDSGLLAFLGLGAAHDMAFGFVSCPRLLHTAEGVNVLAERKVNGKLERALTNIEYCDFARFGIEDASLTPGGMYSRFTCNTNILFVRLDDLEKAIEICPYPGLLINVKSSHISLENGEKRQMPLGRLESTMQNIADVFVEEHPLDSEPKTRRTFVMYNDRKKTISTTKKAYIAGGAFQETPEQGFYDLLKASRELLQKYCSFTLPPERKIAEMQEWGPDSLFLYHPALGPLYSLIGKKIQKGSLALGSEWQLELADVNIKELMLNGSLQIFAERPTESRCLLQNVSICNRGVDWQRSRPFWLNHFERFESMQILLHGRSEFIARGVNFIGNSHWEVEDGMRLTVSPDGTWKKERMTD